MTLSPEPDGSMYDQDYVSNATSRGSSQTEGYCGGKKIKSEMKHKDGIGTKD